MPENNSKTESLEKTLFKAADKLRKNIDAGFKNNDQLKTRARAIKRQKTRF